MIISDFIAVINVVGPLRLEIALSRCTHCSMINIRFSQRARNREITPQIICRPCARRRTTDPFSSGNKSPLTMDMTASIKVCVRGMQPQTRLHKECQGCDMTRTPQVVLNVHGKRYCNFTNLQELNYCLTVSTKNIINVDRFAIYNVFVYERKLVEFKTVC